MDSEKYYRFDSWLMQGSMGSPNVYVAKHLVHDVIKNDPKFFKLKLYEIEIETIDNNYMGGYSYPGQVVFQTNLYWAKNKTEAGKIGRVIRQVYPEVVRVATKPKKQTKVRKVSP